MIYDPDNGDPKPAPMPRRPGLFARLFGAAPPETDAQRRERLGWEIIAAQIAHTSRHHP